jgi:hypothetical protein
MKVLLVGGPVEAKEMASMAKALAETGYQPIIHQFENDSGNGNEPAGLVKRIKSEGADIVFPRKNFYPYHWSIRQNIGTNFISKHLLQLGVPVVGWVESKLGVIRNKGKTDAILFDAGFPFANDFMLIDPSGSSYQFGSCVDHRGFKHSELANPFLRHNVLFIKPNSTGRSTGIKDTNVVHNLDELSTRAGELAAELPDNHMLVTPFYGGREFTVGVIGNDNRVVLPIEVCQKQGYSQNGILLEGVKRGGIPDGRIFVQKIKDHHLASKLGEYALQIADHLDIKDYTRIDFRRDAQSQLHPIDINAVPGIKHMESYIAMAAEYAYKGKENGFSIYGRLISSVVVSAAKRFGLDVKAYPTLFKLKNAAVA